MVKQLTNQEFENSVKNSDNLVFVDFYADWCGPCRMMAPIVEEISEEVEGVEFYKVNCDNTNITNFKKRRTIKRIYWSYR